MSENKFLNANGLRHVISDLKEYFDTKEFIVATALNDLNDKFIDQSLGIQYDTTAGWNSRVGYIPKAGALIIYSDYKSIEKDGKTVLIPGLKVGSGNAYVQDLAFLDEALVQQIVNHIDDNVRHISAAERAFWNHKLDVNDDAEVENESLKFNRD